LSLSLARSNGHTVNNVTTSPTTTFGKSSLSSIAPPIAPIAPFASTRPRISQMRAGFGKRNSFDVAELDDNQSGSSTRRRTQSMSASSLFAAFDHLSISKPETIPKVELATPASVDTSGTGVVRPPVLVKTLPIPGKRLPVFANLSVSPKLDIQSC